MKNTGINFIFIAMFLLFIMWILDYSNMLTVFTNDNIVSVVFLMLAFMFSYELIRVKFNKGEKGVSGTLIVLGMKLIVYFLYLFLMALYFPIKDMKIFVITFMLAYFLGTIKLLLMIRNLNISR